MKASSLPLIKTTRRTETQTQTPLSLPLSFSSTKRANSSHLINDFKVMKFKNTNIHKSLLKKLEKARKTIIEDNDIFIDKEHMISIINIKLNITIIITNSLIKFRIISIKNYYNHF